jgi:hypothetical protein
MLLFAVVVVVIDTVARNGIGSSGRPETLFPIAPFHSPTVLAAEYYYYYYYYF